METIPRLNLLARPALLGLVYRALAGTADGGEAPLTLRRIEQTQAQLTELLKRQSELRASQSIAADHSATARKSAGQAQLDLRIFLETHEPPKRGFLRRLTPLQRQQQRKLQELQSIGQHESDKAAATAERQQRVTADLFEVEAELKDAHAERSAHMEQFEEQLSAHVLELVSQHKLNEARDVLETARRDVRGSLLVGALLVLVELFAADALDTTGARKMLDSLEGLFSQQQDSSPRALALLLKLAEGQGVTQSELGLLSEGSFRSAGLYRLYQLVAVLAGGSVAQSETGPWAGTLRLCTVSDSTTLADLLSAFESEDTIRMTLAAAALLARGELEQLWTTIWSDELPDRGSLIEDLSEPIPAWPLGLVTPWAGALSCFALLALYMAEGGQGGRFGVWLQDSYGWPKDDLYWWMLAALKDDPALRKNMQGGSAQLFVVS